VSASEVQPRFNTRPLECLFYLTEARKINLVKFQAQKKKQKPQRGNYPVIHHRDAEHFSTAEKAQAT